jgi:multiple sugar transport system permease protein
MTRGWRRGRGVGLGIPLWLLIPALLPVLVLSLLPLLQGIAMGFTDYQLGAGETRFAGLEQYRYMVTDRQFWRSFQVGAGWTVAVTAGEVILGLMLAMLLDARLPGQTLARVLVLAPWAIPPVIKGLMWRLIYHPDAGALNGALLAVGLIDRPVHWLTSFTWALPAVIVVGIWASLPTTTVVLLAGLQAIPNEVREAAAIDGAGAWGQFRHVTLPLMKPVILSITALQFMWNFNSFGLVFILTEGGPAGSTRLPMLFAYEEAFQFGNLAYASALGTVMVLVIGLALVAYMRTQFREAQGSLA